ncbi:MAG: octaprenyl diphosphate synthase [Proteobacteria bacterium]|nr:octaprenyl diphosphate synthase [Pseudomonadota bacterium]NIS68799.1 octaprenyl diphosphate synthase [Pseudomonadota bacterium]
MNPIIQRLVKEDLERVEIQFKKNLESDVGLISKIGEHLLDSGGKRFRPMILILSTKLCGYEGERHIPLASVIEFIHTASLLHDDVVDDAELRRGNTSANALWGSEASVLVGDFLFSKSFSLMVRDGDLRILQVISDAATQLAEGEMQELINTSDLSLAEDRYIWIITRKTAALISAACQIGAILGGVDREKETSLGDFGLNLGIAFQLVDDTLDYVSDEKEFGKTIGIDLRDGKMTLPLIHALQKCTPEERSKLEDVLFSDTITHRDFLRVTEIIDRYGGTDYAIERAKSYVERAKNHLMNFDPSDAKTAILALADYVIDRKS